MGGSKDICQLVRFLQCKHKINSRRYQLYHQRYIPTVYIHKKSQDRTQESLWLVRYPNFGTILEDKDLEWPQYRHSRTLRSTLTVHSIDMLGLACYLRQRCNNPRKNWLLGCCLRKPQTWHRLQRTSKLVHHVAEIGMRGQGCQPSKP